MSDVGEGATLNIEQVAEIAGVGRTAVSNWRKRHKDFPIPDSAGRFQLTEVERWLIENGKLDERIPPSYALWSLVDAVRATSTLSTRELTELLVGALLYLHVTGKRDASGADLRSWTEEREVPDTKLGAHIIEVASALEQSNDTLRDLLVPNLEHTRDLRGDVLRHVIDTLHHAVTDTSAFEVYEDVVEHLEELDRFRAGVSTPPDLAELFLRIPGRTISSVFDPAAGQADVLLTIATRTGANELVGYELDPSTARLARARCLLYDVDVTIETRDALRTPTTELPRVDLVVAEPPMAQRDWGDADLYLDPKWTFGTPSRQDATFAWIQTALQSLGPDGTAIVVTSLGPLAREGREMETRRALVESGAVAAIIQLPTRMRTDTSVALAMWVLRPPDDADHENSILLVDASHLGVAGRTRHQFDEEDIERITSLVHRHRHGAPDVPADDEAELAWVASHDQLAANGYRLDPAPYRPQPSLDLNHLVAEVDELRDRIPALVDTIAEVTNNLREPFRAPGGSPATRQRVALDQVAHILGGNPSQRSAETTDGTPIFGGREVRDPTAPPRYTTIDPNQRPPITVATGDVVLALIGERPRAARVGERHNGAVLARDCVLLQPHDHAPITREWLFTWLHSTDFATQVQRRASTLGTVARISPRSLGEIEVPVLDTDDQELITDEADELETAAIAAANLHDALDRLRRLRTDLRIATFEPND